MDIVDIDQYFEKAINHLQSLTAAHEQMWRIGAAEHWDADQETGVLTWSYPDVLVQADFQIIGTYSTLDNSFLWAWDHPSVVVPLTQDAQKVFEFGKIHNIDFLQWRKIECSEEQAWELTALATLVCDRQGAYRGAAGTTSIFMTFGDVSIAKQ
ncbi:MAG: hypothetical protein F6K09_08000 [Merismopedia sp. SIO2A8]|nr:hypothetical protein [Merismopedia sp. SIO2A8]